MKAETTPALLADFYRAQRAAGWLAGLLAALALLGWALDVAALKSLLPGRVLMAPMTAYGLLLAGAALSAWRVKGARWRRGAVRGAGALFGGGGLLVLLLNLRASYPPVLVEVLEPVWLFGRMTARLASSTAFCFVLLGAAYWLLEARRWWTWLGQWLALAVGVLSFVVLNAYLLNPELLRAGVAAPGEMAFNTALAFLCLSLGLLSARADAGLVRVMASAGPGGALLRVLLPALLLASGVLHGLIEAGQHAGWYAPHWAQPLFAAASLGVTLALVWLAARWLERLHDERQASETRFRQAFNLSPLALTISAAADGRLLEVNETFLRRTGYSRAEVLGRTALELGLWVESAQHAAGRQALQQGRTISEQEARFRLKDGTELHCLISAKLIEFAGQPCVMSVVSDISESKRAAERLRESEARFRHMADDAPVMIWVTDETGSCNFLSQSWQEFTGQSLAAGLGFGWVQALHPDDQQAVCDAFVSATARQQPYHTEYRLRRRDGSYAWVIDSARPRLSGSGEFLGYIGSVLDISERKQAEERLRASEREWQQMADAMPQLVWVADAQGVVQYYNRRVQEFGGITQNADGTWSWQPVVHPEELAATSAAWQTAVRAGQPYVIEHRIRMQDGRFRWHLSRGFPGRQPDGTVLKWYGTATDIDDIKQAEERIKLANYRFRVAEEAVRGFNYEWDLVTGEVTRSKSVEHVLGYKRETLARTWEAWATLIHPAERRFQSEAEARAYLNQLKEDSFSSEYRVRHQDGQYRWMLERGLILRDAQGQPHRVIGQTVDISERKQFETEREQLLKREQQARALAEEANRAKDDFLAVVTHELRTPLNAILGHARLFKLRRASLPPDLAAFIDVINRNGERQNELINDLLDTARITTGKLQLEIAPLNLAEVVREALAAVAPSAQTKRLHLSSELDEAAAWITGDARRLQQVVWNLLSNAVKFTGPGGEIRVRLGVESGQAVLRVSDTGQGIAPDFLPHVFERFSQQDPTRTRRYGGLGLGLALVKQLVELHGGTIGAASAGPGCGASFTVTLPSWSKERSGPVTERPVPAAVPSPFPLPRPPLTSGQAPPARLPGVAILLVTDDADTRDLVAALLTQQGALVTTAGTAAAAWPRLTAPARPRLLVCDLGLPGADGYALLRRVRDWEQSHNLPPLPALALTAHDRASDRIQVLLAGFQLHVAKPLEAEELLLVLNNLLERHRAAEAGEP